MLDGLGLGANARAALLTRGLHEMGRFCCALGGQEKTILSLAEIGDFILTATDNQSRNRRLGLALGEGIPLEDATAKIGQEIEGMHNVALVMDLAKEHRLDMPITEEVDAILKGRYGVAEAIENLMSRPMRSE